MISYFPRSLRLVVFLSLILLGCSSSTPVKQYSSSSNIKVREVDGKLIVKWPTGNNETGIATFDLNSKKPLINQLSLQNTNTGKNNVILSAIDPLFTLTVGQRNESKFKGVRVIKDKRGLPVHNDDHKHGEEGCNMWMTFFDKVHKRPYKSHRLQFKLTQPIVESSEHRSVITLGDIQTPDASFKGKLQCTIYSGSPLLHLQAIVTTQKDRCAIIYDAGISSKKPSWNKIAWKSTQDKFAEATVNSQYQINAVRYRTIMAQSDNGCLAMFPPPHQFFYPQDNCHNLKYTWYGKKHLKVVPEYSMGIRQDPVGDGRYIPWHNSPPGTKQRLSVFYLLSSGSAKLAMKKVEAFTHKDSYPALYKHKTFSTHFHLGHTESVLKKRKGSQNPEFVDVFKKMGVNIVHPGEFHGDGNPKSSKIIRLKELKKLFEEGERLSDENFIFLPGEEANCHFGGHWMLLFDKPVYWYMNRKKGLPFVKEELGYGKVYRTGNSADLLKLLKAEGGLAWTAHARIKSSRGFPDKYKDTDFFKSDQFLGAAWKNLPSDLSKPKLGWRILDLMDDMANWGEKKYCPAEVDVFKISKTSELYAHMNINYMKLDKLPKYKDGWPKISKALRDGKFFSTTGEILIPEFTVNGSESGDTVSLNGKTKVKFKASIDWTFPLNFAEVIMGDGKNVFRQKIDLSDSKAFGKKEINFDIDIKDKTWIRFEVWDVAANGAYTQPVWLK